MPPEQMSSNVTTNLSKQNLKLPHAEGEDAHDGGKYETAVKGDVCGSLWAIGLHRHGDQDEEKKPLDTILVGRLPNGFFCRHVMPGQMVCKGISITSGKNRLVNLKAL